MKTKIDLSKVPLSKLLKEVERRQPGIESYYSKIKQTAKKNKLKLAAQLINDSSRGLDEMPRIMLGVLDKKGEFKDFYYDSGLEYEEFNQYIPSTFYEVMESTYKYDFKEKLTEKEYTEEAFQILKKCGYKRLPDWKE